MARLPERSLMCSQLSEMESQMAMLKQMVKARQTDARTREIQNSMLRKKVREPDGPRNNAPRAEPKAEAAEPRGAEPVAVRRGAGRTSRSKLGPSTGPNMMKKL